MEKEITEQEKDMIKEVGNISVVKSSIALHQILGKEISINFKELEILGEEALKNYFSSDKLLVGLHFFIGGDLKGSLSYLFSKHDANKIIDVLNNKPLGTTTVLNEIEVSTIKEISNILSGAYLNALSELSETTLMQSLPHFIFDSGPSILDFLGAGDFCVHNTSFLLKSNMDIADQDYSIKGELILSLRREELDKLLDVLKKKLN